MQYHRACPPHHARTENLIQTLRPPWTRLLVSLAMLVSQPLVVSSGKHVAKLLSQKQVLFVWQMPCKLQGSARSARAVGDADHLPEPVFWPANMFY